jgi:zinc protease
MRPSLFRVTGPSRNDCPTILTSNPKNLRNSKLSGGAGIERGPVPFFGAIGLLCVLILNAFAVAQTTAPSAGGELLMPKAALPGYGVESYRIVSRPDEIISVLRNGATVICKRVPSPVAAVRGYVLTGGVYEGKWLGGGLSHLLEHLVAGGSSERRTETENKELLQKIGNNSNAYTTYDHTAYFVNTTTEHFDDAVNLVTGWMLGAKITEPEYRREYQVVQRELERNKGNPDIVYYLLMANNRYKVSPARVPVIGYQEVIQGLTRDDVFSYYKMAYEPNNMIYSVAADIDPEQMLKSVQQYLDDAKPGRAFSRDIASEPPVLGPRTLVATFPRLGQARLSLGFASVKETDDDMYALDLLAQVLGGGESSILSENIRDQQQLCSAIGCEDDTPAYVSGTFSVDMALDTDKIPRATKAVLQELEKIKQDGVDPDRLARAKAQMKIARLKELQTSQDVAATLGTDYFTTGDAHFGDAYVKRISQVRAEQVQAAARKYLDPECLITTALLPREAVGAAGLPKAEDLLRGSEAAPESGTGNIAESSKTQPDVITRTVLPGGLVVLHKRMATTPLIQIDSFALGGVTTERASSNGIGTLAMTTLRRGTETRSAEQIADFFDLTGGDLTTVCGNNTWYWNVTCTKDDFPRTMEVYADLINHPVFKPADVNEMKSLAAAAIAGEDASWIDQAMKYYKQQFFGPSNSPYQFQPQGKAGIVSRLTADQVRDWYRQKILTAPRVIAVFGDIDNATAVQMAQKYFGQTQVPPIPSGGNQASLPTSTDSATPSITVDRVAVQKTDQEVAGVVIGFESESVIGEPSQPALTVAQTLTGGYGYPTGYIFETLRGQGWSYEAASINNPGRTPQLPGAFMVYAGCDPRNVNKVTDAILENMARLQGTPEDIQPNWFARCKELITTYEALENETPQAQAEQACTDELFGLGFDYHSKFGAQIRSVALPEVQALARARLSHCVVTICTPNPDSVHVSAGTRTYNSFAPIDLTPRGVQHDVQAR